MNESTIGKYLGVLDKEYDVVVLPLHDADLSLVERVVLGEISKCDDSLAVCMDLDSEHWGANFLAELGQDNTGGNNRIDDQIVKHLAVNFVHHTVKLLTPNNFLQVKANLGITVIWFMD